MRIDHDTYRDWLRRFETLDAENLEAARRLGRSLPAAPTIDVVMPVFDPEEAHLTEAIESVRRQAYENWTLCIADDGSQEPHVERIIREAVQADPRIRAHRLPSNGGIARATNAAIDLGAGEYVAFVDHDDVIPPHALSIIAHRISEAPHSEVIYTDCDFMDTKGNRGNPFFKPGYDHDYLLGVNYLVPLLVCKRTLLGAVGGMREGFGGSDDYDLVLRLVEKASEGAIEHVPFVLYHWRMVPRSSSHTRLQAAIDAARRAVGEHCERMGIRATIGATPRSLVWNRVRRTPSARSSVALAFHGDEPVDQSRIDEWLQGTQYDELSVLDSASETLVSRSSFRNAVIAKAQTDLIAFVDPRLFPAKHDWLEEMTSHFADERCAVVGGRTLGADDHVEQSGILLGVTEGAGMPRVARALRGSRADDPGYFGRVEIAHRASAVSGGVILVRKSAAEAAGGFDERITDPIALDVDFCLSIERIGAHVMFTPHAEFRSRAADTRPFDAGSFEILDRKWGKKLDGDPWYNPNLTASAADFGLATPPRARLPWREG